MEKKIVMLVFLLFGTVAFGQMNKKVDSLKLLLQKTNNEDEIVELCENISKNLMLTNQLEKSSHFIDSLHNSSIINSNSLKALLFKLEGNLLCYQGKFESGASAFKKGLKITNPGDKIYADLNLNIGSTLMIKRKRDSAKIYYNKAKISYLKIKDFRGLCHLYLQLSNQDIDTHDFYNAELNLKELLRYNLKYKNPFFDGKAYQTLALIYTMMNNNSLSIQNYKKALNIYEKLNYKTHSLGVLTNLASLHLKNKNIDDAKNYLEDGFLLYKKNQLPKNNDIVISFFLTYIKYLIYKTKIVESEYYFNEILNKNYNEYNTFWKYNVLLVKSEILFKKGEINASLNHLNKVSFSKLDPDDKVSYFKLKSEIHKRRNHFKKYSKNIFNFFNLKDSIYNSKIQNNFIYLQVKYQTQQKENQILKLENEAQQKEISLQKSKTKTNLAIVSIFLVVVGGVLFNRKRKKDQKLQLLETSVKGSEDEKKRIGKELHDGIAGGLMNLVHETETKDVILSHKLLNSYNQIRDLSHQLNNTSIHGELFMDRLFEIVPENNENQLFEVSIVPQYLELEEPYSTHIYRIILELFTNNLKYANASKTKVSLSLENNVLTLLYSDNGKGVTSLKKGNGLKSIDNRVTLLNGKLKIDIEKGFHISIEIPHKS